MRTVSFTPSTATPRPALTPSSSSTPRQTPPHCHPASPGNSSPAGHCSSSRPGLQFRPSHKELSQSGVDSSGYSSSEGTYRKPMAAPCSTGRVSSNTGDPNTRYRSRIKSAFNSLSSECWSLLVFACVCVSLRCHVIISLFVFVLLADSALMLGATVCAKTHDVAALGMVFVYDHCYFL